MNALHSLRDLAQAVADKQQLSSRQIAEKAKRAGRRLSYTTLNHMLAGTYKSVPSTDTLRTLAWLAGVSEEVAFTAAGQQVPGPPLADELPDGADHLSPKSRRVIIDMVRVLIDLETTHDKHTTTTDHHTRPDDDQASTRERGGPDDGEGVGVGEKTGGRPVGVGLDQMDFDLAAHPDMPLERDRFDAEHGEVGEENQDRP